MTVAIFIERFAWMGLVFGLIFRPPRTHRPAMSIRFTRRSSLRRQSDTAEFSRRLGELCNSLILEIGRALEIQNALPKKLVRTEHSPAALPATRAANRLPCSVTSPHSTQIRSPIGLSRVSAVCRSASGFSAGFEFGDGHHLLLDASRRMDLPSRP